MAMLPLTGNVKCVENSTHIIIHRNGKHVLTYNKEAKVPEGVDPKYARSGFIHPISTTSGKVITDDYPLPHHSHQNGLFFAWKKATYNEKKLNFWEPGKDFIRHEKVLEIINQENFAGFRVELAHVSGKTKILAETWMVKVHASTGHIDLTSKQTCVVKSPLILDKIHYGGMAIRGSRQWFPDAHTSAGKGATNDEFIAPAQMITSEGKTQEDGNHSRPKWVCMTGKIDGSPVSITLIPHPTNFRHPQHVRLHPNMPYFCFIPTVEESFKIMPGEIYTSRFRIIVEDGAPLPNKLNEEQSVYAKER